MENNNNIPDKLGDMLKAAKSQSNAMPQGVPANYFANFPELMLAKAQQQSPVQQELAAIAPLLNSISKTPVQWVPTGYFENFQVQLPVEEAKVIKMPVFRRVLQYATAAVVAGVLVVGGYVYTNNTPNSFDFDHYSKLDVASAIQTVSDDELQQYLNSATAMAGADNTLQSFEIEETEDVILDHVSDDELLNYLEEEGATPAAKKTS